VLGRMGSSLRCEGGRIHGESEYRVAGGGNGIIRANLPPTRDFLGRVAGADLRFVEVGTGVTGSGGAGSFVASWGLRKRFTILTRDKRPLHSSAHLQREGNAAANVANCMGRQSAGQRSSEESLPYSGQSYRPGHHTAFSGGIIRLPGESRIHKGRTFPTDHKPSPSHHTRPTTD